MSSNMLAIANEHKSTMEPEVQVHNNAEDFLRCFVYHPNWLSPYNQANSTIFEKGKTLPREGVGKSERYIDRVL